MNKFDKIGIIFLIIGFITPLFVYLTGIIIGLPIYIIGVIILFFGNLKIKQKLLWVLTPLILYVPVFKTVNSVAFYFSKTQKIDLILPANFRGKAIIIDNADFGQYFKKKFNREQIIFDKNGIVFYPTKLKLLHTKYRVFVKKNGVLKQLLVTPKNNEELTILSFGESNFKKNIVSKNKYIHYNFVQIGTSFYDHNYSNNRCNLLNLIKLGDLQSAYDNLNKLPKPTL